MLAGTTVPSGDCIPVWPTLSLTIGGVEAGIDGWKERWGGMYENYYSGPYE